MPVVKVSSKLLDMLNQAIAMEIQVSVQYMWQHVMWRGVSGLAVKDELRGISIEEMKHAESIAERLSYLGGTPTTKPAPIFVGTSLREMLESDVKSEEETIELYGQIVDLAKSEGDRTTARLFRKILSEEEEHHDTFVSILEGL